METTDHTTETAAGSDRAEPAVVLRREEPGGDDDFGCNGPVPLRDTLGGGAAIAISSEAEVWKQESAQSVITGRSTLFTIFFRVFINILITIIVIFYHCMLF